MGEEVLRFLNMRIHGWTVIQGGMMLVWKCIWFNGWNGMMPLWLVFLVLWLKSDDGGWLGLSFGIGSATTGVVNDSGLSPTIFSFPFFL